MIGTQVNYQLLAVFVAVVEASSFSKAARKLGVGKGSVSRAIARLEAILGAELLHRNTHAVALSTAGAALYERAAPHLSALDEAVGKLPERAEQPSGRLRLVAPYDFGVIVLPELLAQFSLRYPQVSFDVRLINQLIDLASERFDLAIHIAITRLKDSRLTARRLCGSEAGFYASPTYLARRGKPKRLDEAGHDWIVHPGLIANWKLPRERSWRFLCDDFFLARDLARDGAGVAFLPALVAEPYVRGGFIEAVPLTDRPRQQGTFFVVYPSSGQVPRKVAAFRDFLLARARTSPLW
jgi:DNA-binding transcriptional LysR family regulator